MPSYRRCKGEAINLTPHYFIDIIHKSHLRKLEIIATKVK